MKMKIDFVTNSSSSAYVVALSSGRISEFESYLKKMSDSPKWRSSEGFRIWERYNNKKELYEYATGRPYDWASKAMKPKIENMDELTFKVCLDAIEDGYIALFVGVDYQGCRLFESSKYKDNIITSVPL